MQALITLQVLQLVRTGISDLGNDSLGVYLEDVGPFSSSLSKIKYALKVSKLGRSNIPKQFLKPGSQDSKVVTGKNSRQRKCCII